MPRSLRNLLRAALVSTLVWAGPAARAGQLTAEQSALAERVKQIKLLQQRMLMHQGFEADRPGEGAAWEAFEQRRRSEEPGVMRRGISQRPAPETPEERAAQAQRGRAAGPLTVQSALSYATNRNVNDPNLDDPARADAQSEPSIAMWGNYVLAGWNDGRGSTFQPGATLPNLLNYGYSTDGGQSFTTGPATGPTALPVLQNLGGVWTSDPVITVNEKTGDFYFCGLFDPPNGGVGPDENGVAVAKARFSGTTIVWSQPVVVRSLPPQVAGLPEIDKPWIAADSTSGNVYLSYTRYTPSGDSILFTRSTDGGAHWSPSITMSSNYANGWVQGSRPAVGPNGEVYVTWKEIGQDFNPASPNFGVDFMRIRRSVDGGVSFGGEQTAATFFDDFGSGAPGFNREQSIALPSIAVDRTPPGSPTRGYVYVAWNESVNFYDSIPDSGTASGVVTETESASGTTGTDDTPATAVPFTVGNAVRGSFNFQRDPNPPNPYSDLDYYQFNAVRGTTYLFYADEVETQYTLRIFGTDGQTRLAFAGDRFSAVASPGLIVWTCPKSGTYYMRLAIYGNAPSYYRVDTGVDIPGGPAQRARDHRDVFVATSKDGGTIWSSPAMLSAPEPPWFDDWLPEVAVAGNGSVYALWYDFADSPAASDGGQSQTYMARSDDAGATWASLGPVSGAFVNWTFTNSNIIPNQGDYTALFANATTVVPCWTDGRIGTPDIWAAPFAIASIQVAIESVVADTNRVTITWHAQGPYPASADVMRADGTGPYQVIGTVTFDGSGLATYADGTVLTAAQYRYALQLAVGASTEILGEWTVLTPGRQRALLSFAGAVPNPTKKKALRVQFTLPDNIEADLRLYDITGRPLRLRIYRGPGPFDVDFGDGLDLKPGIYLLRLSHAGSDVVRRVSIIP